MIKPIHPFPARMAPDLAIAGLKTLRQQSIVLDPMTGSGTVVRHASELGHRAIGIDMDPLAVLMSRVWTTPVNDQLIGQVTEKILHDIKYTPDDFVLPWIDEDEETKSFIDFWFGESQRSDLRKLAYQLSLFEKPYTRRDKRAAADVIRIALSRIIITKDCGASLARDVSHSRPHKVADNSIFQVIPAFERSVSQVRRLLLSTPPVGNVDLRLGDARSLKSVNTGAIDAVLTSPPYLNAIDYMRGHRLSLVWLGYRLSDLRNIRSNSIGAERSPTTADTKQLFLSIQDAMGPLDVLPARYNSMVARYSEDIYRLMSEISRVLKPSGRAILVVGNSCLKGVFIKNSNGIITAASMVGLKLLQQSERELPTASRYLPMPADDDKPLGKRMRTECILTFSPV